MSAPQLGIHQTAWLAKIAQAGNRVEIVLVWPATITYFIWVDGNRVTVPMSIVWSLKRRGLLETVTRDGQPDYLVKV